MPEGDFVDHGLIAEEPEDLARLDYLLNESSMPPVNRARELLTLAIDLTRHNRSLETASRALNASYAIVRKIPDMQSSLYLLRGEIASKRNRMRIARKSTKRALILARVSKDIKGQIRAHLQFSELAFRGGRDKFGSRRAEKGLHLAVKIEDPYLQYRAHYLLGKQAFNKSDRRKSKDHAERAVDAAIVFRDPEVLASAFHLRAMVAYAEDDLDVAQRYAEEALELAATAQIPWTQAEAHKLLGDLAFWRGNLDESRENAEKALEYANASRDAQARARAYQLLGDLARQRRDFQLANTYAQQALWCSEVGGENETQASAHELLSDLARRRGEMQLAQQHASRSLALAEASGDKQRQASAHRILGDLAHLQRDLKQMMLHGQKAYSLAQAIGDRVGQANAETLMARSAIKDEDWDKAQTHVKHAIALKRAAGDMEGTASAQMMLGHVLANAGPQAWPEALKHALDAVRVRERLRTELGSAAAERARYLAATWEWDRLPLQLASDIGDGWTGFELMELGRSEALATLLHRYAGGEQELPGEVKRLLAELETQQAVAETSLGPHLGGREAQFPHVDRQSVEAQIAQLHMKLAALVGNAFQQVFTGVQVTPQELRNRIPADVHVLLLRLLPADGLGGRLLYSVWVPPDPNQPPVIRQRSLSNEEDHWLTELTASGPGGRHAAGRRLLRDTTHPWRRDLSMKLLPDELYALLSGVDPEGEAPPPTLLIAPSGELWGVPFAALDVADRYLLDRAALTLLPSLRLLPEASTSPCRARPDRALAYMAGVSAQSERKQLLYDYAGRLDEVTDPEELVEKLRSGDRYSLAVLAVHGDDRLGLEQSLLLRDRPRRHLSAAQLLGLRLPAHLVLGSCWSGRLSPDPGEEPIGLPTVALTRGAVTLATALYPVPDKATAEILATYYQQLSANIPASYALRNSQRRYIADTLPDERAELVSSPWYWAGLTLLTTAPGQQIGWRPVPI
ncbi:CHAT domain-containing protein [Streptomyces sp. NBC_01762]|uniref:CHAT domain-containing protein n=1 Tax=unclassified Streptomyces TaxID=2593676 RepID=UPI002DD86B39|nr:MULTISPECIES: CHAT domain-containing protein [unclassified Streptomyces]WSC44992.1 CHAT domain-containing protein [Streptomyces sp. NBC_01762]WSD24652.1 CHAT domain-containing protein [Streptomyces sp. NBC_01751]